MLGSKLVPLVVLGGIGAHSGGAIKQRVGQLFGATEKAVARQRLTAVLDAATLATVSDGDFAVTSQEDFRTWARRAVRIKGAEQGTKAADASLDYWGTPLRASLQGGVLTVFSAGPDRQFGSADDLKSGRNIFDF